MLRKLKCSYRCTALFTIAFIVVKLLTAFFFMQYLGCDASVFGNNFLSTFTSSTKMTSFEVAKIKDALITVLDRKFVLQRNGTNILEINLAQNFPKDARPEFREIGDTRAHYVWSRFGALRVETRPPKRFQESGWSMDCYDVTWRPTTKDVVAMDAMVLGDAHWFGGAEMYEQHWPINKQRQKMMPYVTNVSKSSPDVNRTW